MTHWFSKSAAGNLRAVLIMLPLLLAACSSPEQRAQAHYESGNELVAKGEFVQAGLEFRNAIKFNEKLSVAWEGLALVEEKAGNTGGALGALNRVVELDAKNVNAHVKLATFLLAGQDAEKAVIHANAANELKKDDSAILALRGAILFRLNDPEGARADAEKALSINPDNPDAHGVMAAIDIAAGNTTSAMQFINRGLETDPQNVGLLLFKARLFETARDDANFETTLRQIADAHPELIEMRKPLLLFLLSRKRMAEAETELRKLATANPDDQDLTLSLVTFVAKSHGFEAGRAELDRALKDHPEVLAFKLAAARMDFAAGKFEAAKATLDPIIAKEGPMEDVSAARVLLATMMLQRKDAKGAASIVDTVLTADPKNVDALGLRAAMKLDNGDTDGAIADARDALNQAPQSVATHLFLARAYEQKGEVALATERLADATQISGYASQVTLEYVKFLLAHGKREVAVSALGKALAAHPQDIPMLSTMARLKLSLGAQGEAQEIAKLIMKLGDKSGSGEQILTDSLLREKKYGEVISSILQADSGISTLAKPMANAVQAFLLSGKPDEAEKLIMAALEANPKNAEAYVLLGGVKNFQKKPEEAEAAVRKAIEVQPGNAVGYSALANHLITTGRIAEAEKTLKDGLAKNPASGPLVLALGGLLEGAGRIDEAIALYEQRLAAIPEDPVFINNLASLLADYRTDQASLDRAHLISRRLEGVDLPQYQDTLGWIAYRRGEFDKAVEVLAKVAEKLPDLPLARYHYGMALAAMKRTEDAKREFEAAQALLKGEDPLSEKLATALKGVKTTP